MLRKQTRRRWLYSLLAIGLVVFSGCAKVYPVAGKVTCNGNPLPCGQVIFVPDQEKGNGLTSSPFGRIGADGAYTLNTAGKEGAPPGWYKVTVTTRYPGAPSDAPPIPADYGDFRKTTLKIEVTPSAAAGAYDLVLTGEAIKP